MEHGFTWVEALPGLSQLPAHTATALVVAVLVLLVARAARRGLDQAKDPAVPDGRLTARELIERVTGFIADLAESVIGHGATQYVPFFGSLFLFILFSNLIGLVPGFVPPTDNLNTTFGLAAVSFVVYNYYGFREHGAKYGNQFLGPVLWLAPLMIVVELFSHAFRPISLALRLYGNMFADHLVLGIFTELTKVVIPVIFYTLGAFVSVVQAFVFTILTMVYVALAVSHDH
jgi:F-type H+-transporting ATPase subunit a